MVGQRLLVLLENSIVAKAIMSNQFNGKKTKNELQRIITRNHHRD